MNNIVRNVSFNSRYISLKWCILEMFVCEKWEMGYEGK
jgi:hypothetical protein